MEMGLSSHPCMDAFTINMGFTITECAALCGGQHVVRSAGVQGKGTTFAERCVSRAPQTGGNRGAWHAHCRGEG
eukprot:m.278902 g.278902  ORF g.278902 m.278902 type:complete len:74 (+) comp19793_c1_seq4:1382-1603(+)